MMEDKNTRRALIEKYLDAETTPQEERQLRNWFASHEADEDERDFALLVGLDAPCASCLPELDTTDAEFDRIMAGVADTRRDGTDRRRYGPGKHGESEPGKRSKSVPGKRSDELGRRDDSVADTRRNGTDRRRYGPGKHSDDKLGRHGIDEPGKRSDELGRRDDSVADTRRDGADRRRYGPGKRDDDKLGRHGIDEPGRSRNESDRSRTPLRGRRYRWLVGLTAAAALAAIVWLALPFRKNEPSLPPVVIAESIRQILLLSPDDIESIEARPDGAKAILTAHLKDGTSCSYILTYDEDEGTTTLLACQDPSN